MTLERSHSSARRLDFLSPTGHGRRGCSARRKAMHKQLDCDVGKFPWANSAFGIIPSIGVVDDPEQHHGINFSGSFDDLTFDIEPQQ